jgi:hypothetical protein
MTSNTVKSDDLNYVPSIPYFFCILTFFLKKNLEMNLAETYFQDLAPLSCVSPVGTPHEGVTPCALT